MEPGPPLNLTTTVKVEELKVMAAEEEPRDFTVEGELVEEPEPDEDGKKDHAEDTLNSSEEREVNEDTKENAVVLAVKDSTYGATKSYQCSECQQCFSRASQLRSHERSHLEDQVYECDQCDKGFPRIGLLMSHRGKHHRQSFSCTECDAKFPHYNNFRLHLKRHKGERPFQCSDCNMAFVQVCHLHIHRRIHTGEKPFQCDVCEQRFKQVSHLTTHMRIHTKDKPYSCDVCDASFSQTSSLTRHKRRHSGEKPFKCEICGAPFIEKRNLTRHMLTHTGEKPFKCDTCDARFAQMIDCKRHRMSHAGLKPYKCDVCEAAFSRKNNLRWHKLTHEGDTPFKCEKCNAGFSLMRDMKTHMRTHAGIKPYSCDQCSATFAQHSTLKRHKIIHSSERQFICNICKSSFKEKSGWKRHLLRHEGVKPYKCEKCDSTFIEFRNLKRHKVVVHGEERFEGSDVVLDQRELENIHIANASRKRAEEKNEGEPLGELYSANFQATAIPLPKKEILAQPHTDHTESTLVIANSAPQPQQPPQPEVTAVAPAHQPQLPEILTIPSHAPGQMPTLLLTQPGQPPKPARPANSCQNHQSHVLTFVEGSYNQWQSWCFCDTPNIPDSSHTMIVTSGAVVSQHTTTSDSVVSVAPPQPEITFTELPPSQPHQAVGVQEVNQSEYQVSQYNGDYGNTLHHYEEASQASGTLPSDSHHQRQQLNQQNSAKMSSIEEQRLFPMSELETSEHEHHQQHYEAQNQHIQQLDSQQQPILQQQQQQQQQPQPQQHQPQQQYIQQQQVQQQQHQQTSLASAVPSSHPTSSEPPSPSQPSQQQVPSHPEMEANCEEMQPSVDPLVTFQYSLTVSNPATGDIQIQSEAFPASSSDQTPTETQVKRKRNIKGKYTKRPVSENRVHSCRSCPKTFTKENHLLIHQRTHTGEKPFQCGVCRQAFTHKNSLTIHMRGHTGERPYVCTTCETSFTQKSNLRVHMRIHTGEKPFKCTLCSASFTQGSHLTAHIRIHNNDRPFSCGFCTQSFTQRSALKRHTMTHTGHKPHKCDRCSAKFSQKDDLRRHQKIHSINESNKESSPPKKHRAQDSEAGSAKRPKIDEKEKVEFLCTKKDCSSKFMKHYSLMRHIRTVHAEGKWKGEGNDDALPQEESKKKKKRPIASDSPKKIQKSSKESEASSTEPVRTSRRIREAAEKKKVKQENSDFIIGDFVDIVEEEDDIKPYSKQRSPLKKEKIVPKVEAKEKMESWCFCEVPHGPNEPHTHVSIEPKLSGEQQTSLSQEDSLSRSADTSGAASLLQLSMENVQHNPPTVLAGAYPHQAVSGTMTLEASSIVAGPQVVNNAVSIAPTEQQTQGITAVCQPDPSISQLSSGVSHAGVPSQATGRIVGQPVITTTPVLSTGQLVNASQIMAPDAAIYIEAGEVLSNGAVVISPGQGTFISYEQISISSDGQVIGVPVASSGTETLMLQPAAVTAPGTGPATVEAASTSGTVTYTTATQVTEASAPQPVQYTAIGGDVLNLFPQVEQGKESAPSEKYPVVAKPHDCTVCGKPFAQKHTLFTHMQSSHPDLFSCPECCQAFTTREFLESHKAEHQKLHVCSRCGMAFTGKSFLTRHRLQMHGKNSSTTEEKERSFACEICGTKFYQQSDLKRHMLGHTGEKPFKCQNCEAGFTRMSSLNKHRRIHTGEKPYVCLVCSEAFAYRYQFNRHKGIHKRLEQDDYSMPYVFVE